MGILKRVFGLIFGIFGILFGGLWDNIVGAFKAPEDPQESTAVMASAPPPESPPTVPAPVPAPVPDPIPVLVPPPAPQAVAPEEPKDKAPVPVYDPDQMAAPMARRRPGKTMTMFKDMARDLGRRG